MPKVYYPAVWLQNVTQEAAQTYMQNWKSPVTRYVKVEKEYDSRALRELAANSRHRQIAVVFLARSSPPPSIADQLDLVVERQKVALRSLL